MKIINGIENITQRFKNPVVTLGNFDGIHIGHQRIFNRVIEKAKEIDGTSIVFTFEPHPSKVLSPSKKIRLITPYSKKMLLLERLGIDVTINAHFDKKFAEIDAESFVKDILVNKISPKYVIIGYNFCFGKNRQGDTEFLKKMGEIYGFGVEVIPKIIINDNPVNSTLIRKYIREGRISEANHLLGRNFIIIGKVIKGHSRGKALGYPTANIETPFELYPKSGVYAVKVEVEGKIYNGVANIGDNPTFGDKDISIEVYIMDFDGNLYDKELRIFFVDRIRDEKKFGTPELLKEAIKNDILIAKEILK
ncbi:MAG: riboflavin biosynthesis protein RibF [Candidatus Hydrothermota bacterium]|nr:MAG: riboflavin biosynthesis protein RibF [Candidatus Hydrothermae bacterium]